MVIDTCTDRGFKDLLVHTSSTFFHDENIHRALGITEGAQPLS